MNAIYEQNLSRGRKLCKEGHYDITAAEACANINRANAYLRHKGVSDYGYDRDYTGMMCETIKKAREG